MTKEEYLEIKDILERAQKSIEKSIDQAMVEIDHVGQDEERDEYDGRLLSPDEKILGVNPNAI